MSRWPPAHDVLELLFLPALMMVFQTLKVWILIQTGPMFLKGQSVVGMKKRESSWGNGGVSATVSNFSEGRIRSS